MQTSDSILLQTAAPKVPVEQSYGKFGKDTVIAQFLRFREGGTKGDFLKNARYKNALAQIASSPN